jgi:3-oxoacyl-[acyl-carrier protein] reductase
MARALPPHVAIVTGANHGIGAATARLLAARGAAVLCTYRRLQDPIDPAIPEAYRRNRAMDAAHVVEAIVAAGGRAVELEADLADPASPVHVFDFSSLEQLNASASSSQSRCVGDS